MAHDHVKDFELLKNNSFSKFNPLLQIFIDSSSLTDFKLCPRRYYYSIVYGFQPSSESVHLTFGLLLHEAVEKYWLFRLRQQMDHREAQIQVVDYIMKATWNHELNKPWVPVGDERAVKAKNRHTLVRTVVWYLDTYQRDPVKTISVGPNQRLAVELPFKIESGYNTLSTNEKWTLCGRLDRIGELNQANYVVDVKTTSRAIGEDYYKRFTPNNQFSIYTIAAKSMFGVDAAGIIVDACQVVQSFSSFDRNIIDRNELELQQWQDDLGWHLKNLEDCAFNDNWPMNDSACDMYGGCPFRQVCSKRSESSKAQELRTQYKRRVWDPTFRTMDY